VTLCWYVAGMDLANCCSSSKFRPEDEEPLVGRRNLQELPPAPQSQCCQSSVCKCCGTICCVLCGLLLWVLFFIGTAECALESFPVENILPATAQAAGVAEPFIRGTSENMHLDSALGLDLAGTWWMDGNPATFEQLVSYAGATGSAPYPMTMTVPTNLERRWTYSTTFWARCVIFYYSMTSEPEELHAYRFTNSTHAEIVPVGDIYGESTFGFEDMESKDEWDRVDSYTLHRIIDANGVAQPDFWPKFLAWYKGLYPDGKMLVYSSNSACLRRCQYFLPCFACSALCGNDGPTAGASTSTFLTTAQPSVQFG